jgi:NRPS condensation-like uncharacterized protein
VKLVQLAGLFFLGTEEFNASNCMIATVVLKKKLNYQRLFSSYRALIVENPLLQTKIIERPEKNRFCWSRFSDDEIERCLDFERDQLAMKFDKQALLDQYYPTNTRLPFHISVVDDFTIVACLHHALANGRSFIFWIQKWLQYYADHHVKSEEHPTDHGSGRRALLMLRRVGAFLWLPFFFTGFLMRTGKAASKDTIDLSHGKMPTRNRRYFTKSYSIDREDTKKLLQKCKRAGLTLTEYICVALLRELFYLFPEKRRIFISIPMDMHSFVPYSPERMRGNLIASLPAQFFRDQGVEKQVRSVFKWFKRGIPYSLSCLFASASTSYKKTKAQCLALSRKPISERFPLWDFSLTFSNLGVISYPVMSKLVDSIFFSFKSQSILIAISTISGKMCTELSFSRDLYKPDEISSLFDRILSADHLLK